MDLVDDILPLLILSSFALVLFGAVGIAVASGRNSGIRHWPEAFRSEDPARFWFYTGSQAALGLLFAWLIFKLLARHFG